jgi:hypothetical protein
VTDVLLDIFGGVCAIGIFGIGRNHLRKRMAEARITDAR